MLIEKCLGPSSRCDHTSRGFYYVSGHLAFVIVISKVDIEENLTGI